MIVKNEAHQLGRCLDSVRAVVEEMIVVDTGSTDNTIEVAQSLGAQVHEFTWCNDFSSARNVSLSYASGDWILVLDADEVLTSDIVPSIQQVMQQPHTLVANLVRREVGATQSPYSLVSRLFRRHPMLQFSRPYHAMIDDSVVYLRQQDPTWQIVDLPEVAILHYGYAPSAITSRSKLQTAKTVMEGFLNTHPQDPYVCSKLGALYLQLGDYPGGVELLERGLAALTSLTAPIDDDAPMSYELHYHLGSAYARLQQLEQAVQHYQQAIRQPILDCLKLGAYNNLGTLLQRQGHLEQAKAMYETCLAIDPNLAIGHYNLGMTLKAMGQLAGAIEHYQQAISLAPDSAEAHQNLGVALLKAGRVPESLQAFQQAIMLHESRNSPEADRLRQGLHEMGFSV